ncbi:hypothetical protein [Rhodococcoides fascians]|uniref:TRAFAC clade GTPase domain-containing protein n=1 Tax=Rhodococcoides fascians TaxID=1828 RepID=UPI0012D32C06|nr:hypothetical protein [Rhodococcus fascians]
MRDPHATQVLVLGGPSVGKSTFLMQLYGRIASGECSLSLRAAPDSLTTISDGWKRLQQGLPTKHTPHGTDSLQMLPTVDGNGRELDVQVPEYAGEELRRIWDAHRVTERWEALARESDHWVVLIRLSQHPDIPDLISKPVGEIARATATSSKADDGQALPVDMLTVELLQILRHARTQAGTSGGRQLRVTLVLSCWDELGLDDGALPGFIASKRLSLLDSYCRNEWASDYRVLGLSSQGRSLVENEPADEFLDYGPQKMGWLVDEGGSLNPDLTMLLAVG